MKIVKTEEFIKMPAGTIFAPFAPSVFLDGFEIKVDAGDGNSYCGTMPLEPWLDDFTYYCEGQYDVDFEVYDGSSADIVQYDLVAVLEEKDVRNLIGKLEWALNGCKGDI